jgi:hypothetical protein
MPIFLVEISCYDILTRKIYIAKFHESTTATWKRRELVCEKFGVCRARGLGHHHTPPQAFLETHPDGLSITLPRVKSLSASRNNVRTA